MYGTIQWTAPEYLDSRRINERNEKGDIFSFGVIAWELVTRKFPWAEENSEYNYTLGDVSLLVLEGERLVIPETCPKKLREVIEECWKDGNCLHILCIDFGGPKERPSYGELIEKIDKLCRL